MQIHCSVVSVKFFDDNVISKVVRNPIRSIVPNKERDRSIVSRSFASLTMTRQGDSDLSLRWR